MSDKQLPECVENTIGFTGTEFAERLAGHLNSFIEECEIDSDQNANKIILDGNPEIGMWTVLRMHRPGHALSIERHDRDNR